MNLLLFNLATDADDPLLGFTTSWINRLATHYDYVDVVTMRTGRLAVAPNVRIYSVGKERGYSEPHRAIEFYRTLSCLLRERTYDACFAHMMPLFAVMGAPLLRSIPITLWYTHRQAHRTLKLATAVSRRVVTASPDSFPLRTKKLRVIGHGIDTGFFSSVDGSGAGLNRAPTQQPYVVHVARLMPIKHQATLIRALPEVPDAYAVFVGDVPPDQDQDYRRELETLAGSLGVAERVIFAGNQPTGGVRDWLRQASVAVNLSPPGLFDKAALESMAVGVPTIVANTAFDDGITSDRLRLTSPDDHTALAVRLRDLLALPETDRRKIGALQRARVVASHSLDGLIKRLVSVLNTGEVA